MRPFVLLALLAVPVSLPLQDTADEPCGSPKDCPHLVGAMSGDSDRSAKGILHAHPIGFRTRNV
jgi:hypothetical protein